MTNLPQKIFNGDNGMPKINTGQEGLFLLVCKALKEKRIVQYKEIKHIYQTVVQESEFTGFEYWDTEKQEYVWKSRKYSDWEIDNLTNSWLLRALGSLIKKGYLAVIPRIELSKQIEGELLT